MNKINLIMFLYIILSKVVINPLLSMKLRRVKSHLISDKNYLENFVIKLSKCMVGQVLKIESKDRELFNIEKYQIKDLWGMNLYINFSTEDEKFFIIELLKKYDLNFEILENEDQIKQIISDVRYNIKGTLEVINILLSELYHTPLEKGVLAYFYKISLER